MWYYTIAERQDWEDRNPGRGRKLSPPINPTISKLIIEKIETPEGDGNKFRLHYQNIYPIEKIETPEGDGNNSHICCVN